MKGLIFVRYIDHVFYNRTSAVAMKPQIREAVGWLVYECAQYLTLSWDRDAQPPTLKGGDPKASGLVLLKTDIMELYKLEHYAFLPQKCESSYLNPALHTSKGEYALLPKERKTRKSKGKQKGDAIK